MEPHITITRNIGSIPSFTVPPEYLWIGITVIGSLYLLLSIILFYHWKTYGYAPETISRASKIYVIGSVVGLVGTVASAAIYASSVV